jgi:putative peptide zinc metalloprotease protein
MKQVRPARDLERRKKVRVRLRPDLTIEAQKYEGRTYHVVKDPVSLRYFRLKDNERFLLRYLDGKHTLEDAQKAYEKHYRPERIRLEDLEGFAQQLLSASLAQSDTPHAGELLLERRGKRLRAEWMQTLTNLLYIKLPVFDPDRLLEQMLRWLGFIFTASFFALSVLVMLTALGLVLTHFDKFRAKLPDYHAFFSFSTVIYLWAALGVVKVIHEFGHGLSCKVFGGEVHEMGALLLCLSPALYCNVSDAWTLPNKWHRIIISAAGIYVELIIASLATFVWWNTHNHPFVSNLALSLMVVCSVSTIVFNANPLMRYDGYYVLADWLEIPNLRERSNRFLKNLMLVHCLGVEVPPETYMALWRKVLFVAYAIGSYIYRWVVTFAVLWFLYSFLRPYKLEVIGSMLALAALGSMLGWPLYQMGKNLHRRGRLPDMNRWRVLVTGGVLTAVLVFVCFVPVPVSRVRGMGLVQSLPESSAKVFVRHTAILEQLNVRPGDPVGAGDVLAVFRDRDLEADLEAARTKRDLSISHIHLLNQQKHLAKEHTLEKKLAIKISQAESDRLEASKRVEALEKTRSELLVLRAPRSGVIGLAPRIDAVGKLFEKNPTQPFCTINEPGAVRVCLPLVTPEMNQLRETLERSSSAALATRKLLHKPVTLACDRTPLADALSALGKQAGKVPFWLDLEPGAADKALVTFQTDRQELSHALEEMLEPLGLSYRVVSEPGSEHDGAIHIRPAGGPEAPQQIAPVEITLRIQGRDRHTWKGRIVQLPESEARLIPLALSSRAGGPVAVKKAGSEDSLVPQTQHYLVYIEILDADEAILPGTKAQVKIYCQPETCLHWAWRTINNTFDLGLL